MSVRTLLAWGAGTARANGRARTVKDNTERIVEDSGAAKGGQKTENRL